ncbi:MAG TPA: FKBP-type peptidyl-prolyl cis-trans isomerase [Thermoplasmata archaeon]|nr:FKBP-type peptidyl-prolyl cis-trans isomerase [Thermoplasmata archaeon]
MVERTPSRWTPVILVVVVLIVAGAGAGVVYYLAHPGATGPLASVAVGSNVTVNYIGSFGAGPQQGRVFDTSYESVALNNLTYPKALEFTLRSPLSEYSPLGVHVGALAPSSGYTIDNITFGTVVTGFWQGLLGMTVGSTRTITIPPNLGYGPLVPSCLVSMPLTVTAPVVTTVPAANFSALYPNVTAQPGTVFAAAPYNWTALVLNANATGVTVEALPTLGESVTVQGIPARVSGISSTTITVSLELTAADAGLVLGQATTSVCGTSQFIVSSVSPSTGNFTANFNSEVVGATLQFTVSLVQFY